MTPEERRKMDEDYERERALLKERGETRKETERSSWAEVDLEAVLSGELDEAPPVFLRRTDEVPLLYRGKVHAIIGEPESCKGWFACFAAKDALARGEHVAYLDFEDSPKGVVSRMRALGAPDEVLRSRFHYVGPEEKLDARGVQALEAMLEGIGDGLGLVILDGITQALSNEGLNSNDGDEIARFMRLLPRVFSREYGAAVLLVDHVTKSAEDRGRYAIGSQMKLAALDGAQYSAEVKKPFAPGKEGHVRIKVAKDRPGLVRAHATGGGHVQTIAEMMLVSFEDGRVMVRLEVPEDAPKDEEGNFRPTKIMERISEHLAAGKPNKREAIVTGVGGKSSTTRYALDLLVSDGYVREVVRDGRTKTYELVRAFGKPSQSRPSDSSSCWWEAVQSRPDSVPQETDSDQGER